MSGNPERERGLHKALLKNFIISLFNPLAFVNNQMVDGAVTILLWYLEMSENISSHHVKAWDRSLGLKFFEVQGHRAGPARQHQVFRGLDSH